MDTVLAAIRTALLSYRAELAQLVSEEENVAAHLDRLRKRRTRLETDIPELEAKLAEAEKGDPRCLTS